MALLLYYVRHNTVGHMRIPTEKDMAFSGKLDIWTYNIREYIFKIQKIETQIKGGTKEINSNVPN